MTGWTPIFSSIVYSSVWAATKEVKILWITMLALKDKNGHVAAAVPGLARMAGLTLVECQGALKVLESPDPMSNSQEHEGRRIRKVDGGWLVLNHFVYRDLVTKAKLRDYNRQKQQEYRERVKSQGKLVAKASKLKAHEVGVDGNPTEDEIADAEADYRAARMTDGVEMQ